MLNAFLGSLPKETRMIFLRRYWHVDTIAEIAQRYGITQSKVKMGCKLILRSCCPSSSG